LFLICYSLIIKINQMNENESQQQLRIHDTCYQSQFTRKFLNRKQWKPVSPGVVSAFLPGTVFEIRVSEGQNVSAGDIVLRFEAMKMINDILSPVSGTVQKIHVTVGTSFSKGTVLMEIV